MIESPKNTVAVVRTQYGNNGSNINKLFSKVSDIFKNQQQKTNSLSRLSYTPRRIEDDLTSNVIDDLLADDLMAERLVWLVRDAIYKISGNNCKVILPALMAHQIAKDILDMSENEPCGIRGCLLYISYDDRNTSHLIGQYKLGDRTVISTFEMYVHIKRKSSSNWLQKLTSQIISRISQETVVISDSYKLSKKKLFR